ncbi:hypothetical protein ANN_20039 [Periplaneta americana]|uniref:Uncharacterized protein n=1 Tax=Periplaneta americana TaxID=6978 RepID=A0ABQ8SBI9_PERAM|nr:hypothetical protein ANN_20039 [Periplaneta americana]
MERMLKVAKFTSSRRYVSQDRRYMIILWSKYMIMSRDENIVRNGNIKIGNLSFEEVKFKYLGATCIIWTMFRNLWGKSQIYIYRIESISTNGFIN